MSENSDIFSDNHQNRCKYYFGMPDTDITKIKSWNFLFLFLQPKKTFDFFKVRLRRRVRLHRKGGFQTDADKVVL